ncbi:hypothetical protein UVI_02016540 [Ustilaginoidea virens]|uniref:F-box domain-containing protein n=1 Tax=Ustilaginoidea virens TaxID=1159556 RepID=A0A1B5KRN9_USTVR|nr:hypothetical protein UVI_02016540 [Ustilaginoidea virens]
MASSTKSSWDKLPDEMILQLISFSKRLRKLCLDDELWKHLCFEKSTWYQALRARRSIFRSTIRPFDSELDASSHSHSTLGDECMAPPALGRRRRERQDMANWDPVFPGERVSWYDEFIHRHAGTCVNWLETPRIHDRGIQAIVEARGMALYNPYEGTDGLGTMLAVSPLDDGSVCLWDVKGTRGQQGRILATSEPDILFINGPGSQNSKRSKKIDTGVTECVSVNNGGSRAFFAVQSHLIEVDLNRLQVVSQESFEWSITTLSAVSEGVPLTVGTALGIHLHDFRRRAMVPHQVVERLDGPRLSETDVLRAIFDSRPLPPYAPLAQPTPISILHLPRPGSHDQVSDDIYVSGRFSNILHYDRRKFPAIAGSIWSGALIKSLTALPYPYSTVDAEVRRLGNSACEPVGRGKAEGQGRTLIAGGGYKSKGSLEVYGLSCGPESGGNATLQNSVMKNRQTAASSTILSVASHGTRIVFSDGSGFIKWFERDGCTECRHLKVGHSGAEEPSSLFASMPASDDMARKIVSTRASDAADEPNQDNILLWTGERLGMVSFTASPLFVETDFEAHEPEADAEDTQRHEYAQKMRRALEQQADEVKFMSSFGYGAR